MTPSSQRSTPTLPPARHVVVVGAGVGGLAAAVRLAAAGLRVTLLEAAAQPGGKLRVQTVAGRPVDAGPTVLTMRGVFDALFEAAGERLDAQLTLRPAQVLARHHWPDGSQLDLHADLQRSLDAIGAFAGAAEAAAYRGFCARAAAVHAALDRPFMRSPRPTPLSLAWRSGIAGLPALWRIAPFETLWSALGTHFRDPRLRQLFARYATYCGSSPWLAPATLMLVAHVERVGVWYVDGGMAGLADALARLAARVGVRVRCATVVRRVVAARGAVRGVELDGGERIDADAVVFNGDPAALAAGLLGPDVRSAAPALGVAQRSLSAITWAVCAQTEGVELLRHNVFFGGDYRSEFDALLGQRVLPAEPTVYVCAQDRSDPGDAAPREAERLLCLVNAPARTEGAAGAEELSRCERAMWERLARSGLRLRPVATPVRTTPEDFHRLFPATGGALYGMASHGWRAAFRRPAQRTRIRGLVLCGGATHPGPGLPMAALSGELAAAEVLRQTRSIRSASTWTSPPVATPGGTSTR